MDNFDRHSVFSLATPEAAPACLARRHSRWLRFCLDRRYSSTSLPPLAPSPLRDFTATMEALTPIRPALRSLHEHRLFGEQVSLHVSDLPIPPSPTTPQALDADFVRYPSSRRVSCLRRSRLHLVPAGSPTLTGRIEFVIPRMDRSPPAAPHPAARRRSCSRLQAGERIPEEDSHLSDQTRFQAHWKAMSPLPHAVWLRWKGEMSLKEQKGNLLDEHFVVDEANWTAKNRKTGVVTNESIRRLARVP
jgi:hypothetical protein